MKANKLLGQHWLLNDDISRLMCNALSDNSHDNDCVVEIGYGCLALTRIIINECEFKNNIFLEIDKNLYQHSVGYFELKKMEYMDKCIKYLNEDVLKFDFNLIGVSVHIISNIAFNIIKNLFSYIICYCLQKIESLVLLMPMELYDVIAHGSTAFGRFVYMHFDCHIVRKFRGNKLFSPNINFDCIIVKFVRRSVTQKIKTCTTEFYRFVHNLYISHNKCLKSNSQLCIPNKYHYMRPHQINEDDLIQLFLLNT